MARFCRSSEWNGFSLLRAQPDPRAVELILYAIRHSEKQPYLTENLSVRMYRYEVSGDWGFLTTEAFPRRPGSRR